VHCIIKITVLDSDCQLDATITHLFKSAARMVSCLIVNNEL